MPEKSQNLQPSSSQIQLPHEIELRLLRLLDSITGSQDLTLDRFKAMMLLPEAPGIGRHDGQTDRYIDIPGTGWTQSLSFSDGSDGHGIEYRLDHPDLHSDALPVDFGNVCGLDFDAYRDELLSIGYLEGPSTPDSIDYQRRGTLVHSFSRAGVIVDILSAREAGTAASARQRRCIQQIEIRTTTVAKAGE